MGGPPSRFGSYHYLKVYPKKNERKCYLNVTPAKHGFRTVMFSYDESVHLKSCILMEKKTVRVFMLELLFCVFKL